jgi:hypothetical protein
MPSSGRGVIYTAIRERFVDEARISARSVRRFLPDARIVLFTDLQLERIDPFDKVIRLTSLSAKPHLDKLHCMKNSPFAETLFLDTDTYVCGELSGLFELLAQFDIAMTLDRRYYDDFPPDVGVPGSFCEFNQGVVAFRGSERMQAMLQAALDWAERIRARTGVSTGDQIPTRLALYSSGLRIAPLPLEYNCRFHSYGYLNGKVRILHARIPGMRHTATNLERIARKLNEHTVPRVFVGGRMHVLGLRQVLGQDHMFARRGPILFRPSAASARMVLGRIVARGRRALASVGTLLRPGPGSPRSS